MLENKLGRISHMKNNWRGKTNLSFGNAVCYFHFFDVVLASKGSNFLELIYSSGSPA